jgi:hypothetical protein
MFATFAQTFMLATRTDATPTRDKPAPAPVPART